MPVMVELTDRYGRLARDLRVSLTDRCNLRCLYCRPAAEWTFLPHEQILSFEEMAELVDVARLAVDGSGNGAGLGFVPDAVGAAVGVFVFLPGGVEPFTGV